MFCEASTNFHLNNSLTRKITNSKVQFFTQKTFIVQSFWCIFLLKKVLQSGALRMKRETAYQSIYSCNCDKHELNIDKVILNCWGGTEICRISTPQHLYGENVMFNKVLTDKVMGHPGNGQLKETSEAETRSYQSYPTKHTWKPK